VPASGDGVDWMRMAAEKMEIVIEVYFGVFEP
jgi:hypothetical protein